MTMTVKQLIKELERIENKYLEVEIQADTSFYGYYPISHVVKVNKKVIIFTKDGNE